MKERLDVLLVKTGYAASREKAKALILAGSVYVNGIRQAKAGAVFEAETAAVELKGDLPELRYVSRGGLKLEKALKSFCLCLKERVCMDIGASTGGFTDCMLQNGARRVYAIDVGSDQLSPALRKDPRVICMEKTNFRYLEKDSFAEQPDFASADVSFISLTRILPAAWEILGTKAEMVCLIKPQFEAGRGKVGKKGVVRDPRIHEEVISSVISCAESIGFLTVHLDFSPIRGPEGNVEYLVHLLKGAEQSGRLEPERLQQLIPETVKAAHARV